MGVKLGGLVEAKKVAIEDLAGRKIAIDGHNILYQFLAIIRGPSGDPLRDREGRVTSHLSGLIYRSSNLVEAGIRIAYVFDGKPHEFKSRVVRQRKKVRREARTRYEEAVREGRAEEARRYAQQAATVDTDITADAKRLLSLMGLPWVQAPEEGEAQSSYMARKGDVWASASQDFDSLLYRAPVFIRNLSITGRRKLPRKNVYIRIEPELIELGRFLRELEVTEEQLVDIGILVGTDYNPAGVKGVGPKTALKLIKRYGSLERALPHIKGAEFPHPVEEIRALFLDPGTTDDYSLEWRPPDRGGLVDFLCGERDFDRARVHNAVDRIERGFSRGRERTTLDQWFRPGL
ncbi:MAG: flap endonuclease-1 [Candidatus Bathyarchaeota archaeon]|nr:MAG: flap endonuclease-1 [Candidatus Bathyarchaeota archaeon]